MAQINTRGLQDNAITDQKIRLRNNQALRARNAADSGDVSIIKLNASDVPEFATETSHPFTPSTSNSIANKQYVDDQITAARTGLFFKDPVRVASTANVSISSAPSSIDGVTLSSGDRVLLKDQTAGSENGIYVFNGAASAMTRATDADTSAEVKAGIYMFVNEGTVNADLAFVLTTNDPITLDTTALTFAVFPTAVSLQGNKENITLSGTDITNQYVDLAYTVRANTLIMLANGVQQIEGTDYTLSVPGSVTRVTFAGDIATGGSGALVATDVIHFQYLR